MSKIKPLDKSVVNRIAAGEIIIAPANALKEMLENSIDAGATNIEVFVKEGGIKMLQITDNGSGIDKEDLPVLCQRFTTSKLVSFEDLNSLTTYGFRGEALASISHIAHVSVVTKTQEGQCGWKAVYSDGEMVPGKTNEKSNDPKPIASKKGTQITVEDFFYNVPSRLRALKSASEEFGKILDVIGRYAVHTPNVGFMCKKFGDSHHSLATRANIDIKERIRIVFGNDVAANLIPIEVDPIDEYGVVRIIGQITNPNYNNRRSIQPVFFINNRLVTNDTLKRALISSVNHFLPKGHKPFIYLSLEIKPENLDVNVHPTKREVRFLNEDEIIDKICLHLTKEFNNIDSSRTFQTESLPLTQTNIVDHDLDNRSSQQYKKIKYDYNLVRTDSSQSKITSLLPKSQTQQSQQSSSSSQLSILQESDNDLETQHDQNLDMNQSTLVEPQQDYVFKKRDKVDVNLQSIIDLRMDVKNEASRKLTEMFSSIVYIGIIDETIRLIAVQQDVKLMLMDFGSVLNEFFYQVALTNFSNFGVIHLEGSDEELSLTALLGHIFDDPELTPQSSIDEIVRVLMQMQEMLFEYFAIQIVESDEGIPILKTIPLLLKSYTPPLSKLPVFLYKLGTVVNWEDEKTCLQGVLKQISLLYIPESIEQSDNYADTDPKKQELLAKYQHLNESLENVLIPTLKRQFLPPKRLDKDLVEIANLPGLYRVFERC